jgi:putative membrane protein
MPTGYALATFNASCNATCAVLILLGVLAIKRRDFVTHKRYMLAAFVVSCVFLTSYLTRIAMYGDTKFAGVGTARVLYFTILISHVFLALITAPGVIAAVRFGLRNERPKHKKLVRWIMPIWMYVCVTGVLVYAMLYHW